MANFLSITFLLATFAASAIAGHSPTPPSPSPSPSPSGEECSVAVMGMTDCLDYIEVGSKALAPSPTCCNELKRVVEASRKCLCEALQMASQLGIKIDMGRALTMPRACRIEPHINVDQCSDVLAPAPSPLVPSPIVPVPSPTPAKPSPGPSPSLPVSPPTPTVTVPPAEPPASQSPSSALSPAPAPTESGSWQFSSSMLVLTTSVVIVGCLFA